MKSNARCWTPRAAAPLIATLCLSGCVTAVSEESAPCPPVIVYTSVEQARVSEEVDALAEGAIVVRMLSDYAVLRDQARACR
jgi:hypothetical protein